MKKILFFASALAGLFATSCQQELLEQVQEGNVVTFEVNVPEVATKAVVDDGSNINDLVYAVYRTAATTEAAAKSADDLQLIYQKNYETNPFQGGKAIIPIELINDQNYIIVFWAQVDDAWIPNEAFENFNFLYGIAYPESMNANDNNLAAFTNVAFLSSNDTKGGAVKRDVVLHRPFAQINIGTTLPINVIDEVELSMSSVRVTGAGEKFDPIKQEVVGSTNVYFKAANVPGGNLKVNETEYSYAAMNYIFANGNVGVEFNIKTASHGTVRNEAISEVPVQTNYRTNIVGNLLTSHAEYSVTLDKEWGGDYNVYDLKVGDNYYKSFTEAVAKALETGQSIEFLRDVETDADETITIEAGKTLTLNLNGFTLCGITDDADKNDDGKITSADNEAMFDVRGTMNVNNGTIHIKHVGEDYNGFGWNACGEVFYVAFGGTLNIEESTIENLGGVSMAYAIDMVNATDGITLKVLNSTLKSSYIPVRVFNNGAGMNNVAITNSTLHGTSRAFWVHIYTQADDASFFNSGKDTDGNGYKNETLNINIFNPECNNTFIADSEDRLIEYGFTNEINPDEFGALALAEGVSQLMNDPKTILIFNATNLSEDNNEPVDALAWIDENIDVYNGFEGYTIKLAEDIDCFKGYMPDGDPVSTQPIGQRDYTTEDNPIGFKGTFDGNNHAIRNLYQNGWALGYEWGAYGSIGLFSRVEDATIKNLTIDKCEMFVEGGNVAAIAGNAAGDCTFENITIKNTSLGSYNNGVAGIVAWSETGNYTFKNIVLEETLTVASLWGFHGAYLGGVIAEAYADCSYKLEDIVISCRLDAYNDVVSNYQWYAYRCDGMIVGNVETRQTIGDTVYPDPAGCNITCKNVTVNYGDWMNYHYCESPEFDKPSYAKEGEWKFKRVEPGYSYGGIDYTKCNHGANESHFEYIPFNQLFGGGQNGSGHDPVYGLVDFPGVTVNYPESFYREQGYKAEGNTYTIYSGKGFKDIATTVLNDGTKNVTIELANDIDLAGIEWPAVKTAAAFVLDGKGYSIKNLTTSAVEDHGFYSTAMFTSTRKATTIKDLVVENATVTGKGGDNSHGAVLVACNYAALNIEGVTVKNSTVSNCDRSSALVTYLYFTTATVKDCVVEGCTVNSIGTAGALLGMNNSHDFEATGNKVKDTTISSSEGSNKAGILIGTWQDAGTLTESGNVVENSKAVNAGTETNNNIGRHA